MADNKKYYYIRLKENFFDSDEIKLLESVPNDGYKFSNILLKMYLKSLKYNGRLMFNERIPFNKEMLATVTNHSIGDVTRAIDMFKKFGLIEVLETGEIYMLDIQSYIGRTSTESDRKRQYRKEISDKKQIGTNVREMSAKFPPEIEIELEKDIEIKKEIDTDIEKSPAHEMLAYFNQKINRDVKNAGTFSNLVLKNVSVEEFKDVVNYVASWPEDVLQNTTASTIAKKFDSYSDRASELGFKDGNEPKKKTRHQKNKIVPKVVTGENIELPKQQKEQELPLWTQDI